MPSTSSAYLKSASEASKPRVPSDLDQTASPDALRVAFPVQALGNLTAFLQGTPLQLVGLMEGFGTLQSLQMVSLSAVLFPRQFRSFSHQDSGLTMPGKRQGQNATERHYCAG